MLQVGDQVPRYSLPSLHPPGARPESSAARAPRLLAFFETDCPTCLLTLPYLNRLAQSLGEGAPSVVAISQDSERATREVVEHLRLEFPVVLDEGLSVSRLFDPVAVPTLFLVDGNGTILQTQIGFDKGELNAIAARLAGALGKPPIAVAEPHDGAPDHKPGCASRHLEGASRDDDVATAALVAAQGTRASRVELEPGVDVDEYCREAFGDPLPVVPPTVERVERMLAAVRLDPLEVVGRVAPNLVAATVEKIAANAVMAGCRPEVFPVLLAAVRAACDERFDLHGVQATTHFAAPLVIVNGPVRNRLGFARAGNVFSNVARANSTLGRALQLVLINLGGARPGEIDMSTLGNPGKFSYCIAENEEESPWEPLHVERGFRPDESTVTLFGAEPPRGVSEHQAREGRQILRAVAAVLATVFSYRTCGLNEALVVLCPEHVKTLGRDGLTKSQVREFLFENTGVPVRAFRHPGEGMLWVSSYREISIDGEPCYQKFRDPEEIKIVVAGGTAGKFSAVLGGWAKPPLGSEMVTIPIL